MSEKVVKIGLFSRIDAGSVGYRRGLVEAAFEIFKKEKVNFIILVGGLVCKRSIKQHIKQRIDESKQKNPEEKINREEIEKNYLDELTNELATAIPVIPPTPSRKLYLMTSLVYDGTYGAIVAKQLSERRSDIRYWEDEFYLKGIDKRLLCLLPKKEPWRSEYDSPAVDREVKDQQKRTTKPLPDIYVVGCLASSLYKARGGEAKRSYLSIPALHKIENIRSSESQIGVTILEIRSCDENMVTELKRTYNLKDMISNERRLIPIPPRCSKQQKKVLNALKSKGGLTIGMIEDITGISRKKLNLLLKRMLKSKRFQPKICFSKTSGRYDFEQEWIQKNLSYTCLKKAKKEWQEDVLVSFGCLHAGSVHTDYDFFINQLPKIIIETKATTLIGGGDFIEGLKHRLIEKGEVYGGLNYTLQEKLAAHLVAEVILKIFEARFQKAWKSLRKKQLSEKELMDIVCTSLVTFVYREGNHDQWTKDIGVAPLVTFQRELKQCVNKVIVDTLRKKNYYLNLHEVIEEKIIKTENYILPSGVSMGIFHPHMARVKTTTLRLQEFLKSKPNCQILFLANFHTAVCINQWDPEIGQRVGVQLGTIVRKTGFEENKGKEVDIGVNCLRILSENNKIMMTEEMYIVPDGEKEGVNDEEVLQMLEDKIGIRRFF